MNRKLPEEGRRQVQLRELVAITSFTNTRLLVVSDKRAFAGC
jgi:hypothetical protein